MEEIKTKIRDKFKKSKIGTGDTFTLIKNLLNANSHEDKWNVIAIILQECHNFLRTMSSELSPSKLDEISNIVDECFNSNSRTSNHEDSSFQVEKSLYNIMFDLIKFDHNKECSQVASHTIGQFDRRIRTDKLEVTPDLKIIVEKCFSLLWNHGIELGRVYNLDDCSRYYLHALECLSFVSTTVNDMTSRAIQASSAISKCTFKLDYFKRVNDLVLNALNECSDIPENEIPGTLHSLYKWKCAYAFAMRKENKNSSWRTILLETNVLLDKFAPGISRSLKETPVLACSKCLELLTCGLEMYSKPVNVKLSQTFTKTFLHVERIFSKTFVLQNKSVHQFALDVSRLLVESIPERTPEFEEKMNEDLLANLKSTYFLRLHLLSAQSEETELQKVSSESLKLIRDLFYLYEGLAKREILFKLVMTDATSTIPKIPQFCNVKVNESFGDSIANIGLVLGNLGSIAYNKKLHADAIPFLKESCNILLNWCKQGDNTNERITKVRLENKHQMLIVCLRKTNEFSRCTKILMDIIPFYLDSAPIFISYWISIQNDMKNLNSNHVKKSLSEAFHDNKISLSDDESFRLLQVELQILKPLRSETREETYCIVLSMIDVAAGSRCAALNTAIALLEFAQIQWYKPFYGEKTAKTCCKEALKMLNDILKKSSSQSDEADVIKIHLARSLYWQYLINQQEAQQNARDELSKLPLTPFELKRLDRQDGEYCDCDPIEDYLQEFANTTVTEELESLAPLNRALDLWATVIESDKVSLSASEQILIELQSAAEIYFLAKQEAKEIKVWGLARRLASRHDCHSNFVTCSSRLIRAFCCAGNITEAKEVLQSCDNVLPKLKDDTSEHVYALLRFRLAFAEFLFFIKDVKEGLKVLRDIWNHPFLEKKNRFSYLLYGEMRVVAGQFVRLPAGLHETKINASDFPWGSSNAAELVLQGMNSFLRLVTNSPRRDCHYVTASLMDALVLLAQMSLEIGVTREARWFLKEQFNNSHDLTLGIRMSEYMLGLARLDLIGDKKKQCLWKLQAMQLLLDKEDLRSLDTDKTNSKITKNDRLSLSKLNIYLPQYLFHLSKCTCSKCQIPFLRLLALQMLNLYVEHFSIYGSVADALQLSRIAFKLSSSNLNKYVAVLSKSEACLNTSRLLLAECKYSEALSMIEDSIKQLEELPYMCSKLAILLPELIYQKSICCMNILAARSKSDILNLVDSLWSINRPNSSDESQIRNKRLLKLGSAPREPLSPIKLRPPNQDARTGGRDLSLLPRNLMNAPVRKSQRLLDRWTKSEEPGSDEEGNAPTKKGLLPKYILPFDPENLLSGEAGFVEGESALKLSDSLLLPLTDKPPRDETVRVKSARTKRTRGTSRTVQQICNKENMPNVLSSARVAPIEILQAGVNRRGVNSRTETPEEKEISRNVEENFNFEFTFETESIPEEKFTLDDIIGWLEKALSLTSHFPVYPIYPNLCYLLALLKGPSDPLSSYYLSDSNFITLRHQCIINLGKKLAKKSNSDEDSIKLANYYNTVNFNAATDNEKRKKLENHIECLPKDWTVCQISFIPDAIHKSTKNVNQPLLLTRFQKGKKPIVVRVPTATYEPEEVPCTLLEEFDRINEANRNTMKSDDRVIWWQSRRSLDERMKNFIADLENVWIGYRKGLFLGRPIAKDDQKRLTTATQKIWDTVGKKCGVDIEQLEIFLDSEPWLTDEQFQQGINELFGFKENSIEADELSAFIKTKMARVKCTEINRQPVVLILGKEIESLPWESMPIIRDKSISRMPSLSLLDGHLSWQIGQRSAVFNRGVDTDDTYFVLNPSNDLPHTQKKFEDWFTKIQKWPGVVGRPPTAEEFSDGLTMRDLFIYCGHGTGGKYLCGDLVQRLYGSAVTLLMGCSSGKLRSLGRELEPTGTVLQYLLAGCPSVVADLWDVTDRDIDRFLESLLSLWMESKGGNLCQIIPAARLVCRLPYLIGAAPVTYGLPVNNKPKQ